MPQFFQNKRLMIVLAAIIVLVALLGYSLRSNRNLSIPEQFIKDTVSLTEKVFNKPAQFIAGFFNNIADLKDTYEENQVLKSKLDKYVELSVREKALEKENKELKDMIGIKKSLSDYDTFQATVTIRDPDKWQQIITIDKGSLAGIEKEMAVITSKGLIGKVKNVSKFSSTVQLLSSSNRTNRISAKIQEKSTVFGLIEGYDVEKQALLLKRIPSNAKVKKGQTVVTSGLGGVFPANLPIGKVEEVVPDEHGLTLTAYIKPQADFNDINHVLAVKRSIDQQKEGE
ncbi:rod shape-determining protein MreC [Bacillus sp. AFS041924]|uniref:rod shape-determining protein MreC n=1 Tax=Bacillus sp. AFS041924 TaxID=2033503 RepID=UPI000BFC4622|nr:rod shape-determining protein MreC [Bacillus sp. AFS041924]PGS53170.1 rod shape-determining protein MreC [Bacillus sp. AFS041924]